MEVSEGSHIKKVFYSIFVPPLAIFPIGLTLFFMGVDVGIIKDIWYLSIFVSCVILTLRDGTPLSRIGLSRRGLGLSLLLTSAWEIVTFIFLGLIPIFIIRGRLPKLVPFKMSMITSVFHFMLVGVSEETWIRGLLLKRLREWRPKGSTAVLYSSTVFVLFHVPAAIPIVIKDISIIPNLALSWSTLFVWSAGLAFITIKTGNLFGPIIIHGLDNIISKVIFSL